MKNKFDFLKLPEEKEDINTYNTLIEIRLGKILSPLEDFITNQVTASLLLCFSTVLAIILATLPFTQEFYRELINTPLGVHIDSFVWVKDVRFWVNDVLLCLFFFVIGLEIKREFIVGELKDIKKSSLTIIAAIGGMVIPASIFSIFNYGTQYSSGFGIPIATDAAFAIGMLTLFRNKLPEGVFPFIAALAIIDDIGAISVIAIFYSTNITLVHILLAAMFTMLLCCINICGVRKPFLYIIIGFLIWLMLEQAGIHGTITGIIVAFTIPARPQKGPNNSIHKLKNLIHYFEQRKNGNPHILKDHKQHLIVEAIQEAATHATTPLQRWKSNLEVPVAVLVLPIFALFNAGVSLNMDYMSGFFSNTLSLGIMFGLLLGKPLGIFSFVYTACKLGYCKLPNKVSFYNIFSISFLCGIGFTMSIFIADINFSGTIRHLEISKITILLASLLSAVIGSVLICWSKQENSYLNTK